MPAVVSDASVLICLGAVGQIHLLKDFFQEVFVPDAVWQEVTVGAAMRAGAKETVQARHHGWLQVQTPDNRALVASLQITLDAGEAEAIALASEIGAGLLLMDESDGRAEARSLGLQVTGTLGVLLRARQERGARQVVLFQATSCAAFVAFGMFEHSTPSDLDARPPRLPLPSTGRGPG